MKVSVKVKVFCYVAINFGLILSSGVVALQADSLRWGIIIFLSSTAWLNFMLWFLFRMRDKSGNETGAPSPQGKQ
jgi:hypothetical protein